MGIILSLYVRAYRERRLHEERSARYCACVERSGVVRINCRSGRYGGWQSDPLPSGRTHVREVAAGQEPRIASNQVFDQMTLVTLP